MKNTLGYCYVVLVACSMGATSAAADGDGRSGALNVFGTDYPNACSAPQQKVWKRTLEQAIKDAKTISEDVELILCASRTPANKARAKSVIHDSVTINTENVGDEPETKVVAPDDVLIDSVVAGGEAWGVEINAGPSSVVVQYYPNEVCVKSLSFNKEGGRWMIDAIREACD